MFEHGFPPYWSTIKKLIWLVGTGIVGGVTEIWKTVTGTLIHITDALEAPMQKCEVSLEPIQDLHGQDAPYPAGGGKNKLYIDAEPIELAGITATVYGDGSIKLNGRSTDIIYIFINSDFDTTALAGLLFKANYISGVSYRVVPGNSTNTLQNIGNGSTETAIIDNGSGNRLILVIANNITLDNVYVRPRIGATSADVAEWSPFVNICPITGWTGCEVNVDGTNLWDDSITPETIQAYAINGTPVTATGRNLYLKSGAYTFSFTGKAGSNYIYGNVCNSDGSWVSTFKLTAPTPQICTITLGQGQFAKLFVASGSPLALTSGNIQLEVGSSATDYEPYSGTTLSVTFPDTVYGGSHEFVSGGLKSKMASVDMGTLTWLFAAPIFYALVSGSNPPTQGTQPGNIISSQYKVVSRSAMTNDGEISLSTNKYVNVIDSRYSSAAEFKTAMSGVQLVYELATPIEIQLTPQEISTLKGVNNVWSNSNGDTTIIYKAQSS